MAGWQLREYRSTSATKDEATLNHLLDHWTQPVYDYYTEWLEETLQAIENSKDDTEKGRQR